MSASTATSPRILVIRRRYLGDIVLLGPLFHSLKAHWPDAHISAVVEPAYRDVLAINHDVNEVFTLPTSLNAWPRFFWRMRRNGFTHVIDLDNTERTALLSRSTGAKIRVLLHHGGLRVRLRVLYTHALHDPAEQHERRSISDYYLRALEPLGVPATAERFRLIPRAAEVDALRRYIGASPRILLVHPGSRSPSRVWPAALFAQVCDRIQDELDTQIVLVGGPGERPLLEAIRGQMQTHPTVFEKTLSIPQFAALAQLCSVLLCHDSGPMHVAAATGIPVVAILGSQNAAVFPPIGEGHTLLQPPLPCTHCVAPERCVPHDSYRSLCVQNLTPDRVFAAVRDKLQAL